MNFKKAVMILCLMCLVLVFGSCCRKPWWVFSDMPRPPDQSFRTGSVHGYDVYIWECLNNKRTVVYQYSAEMTCKKAQMEQVPCGERTPIEMELEVEEKSPVPDTQRWPE